MHWGARCKKVEILKALINAGADLNAVDQVPIMHSCWPSAMLRVLILPIIFPLVISISRQNVTHALLGSYLDIKVGKR